MERMGNPLSPKKSAISLNNLVSAWNNVVSSVVLGVAWDMDYHLHRKVVGGI
jgi:hypothetical protein